MEAITDAADRPTCSATLALEQSARVRWDVLIAGAGPAGSIAARELARCGVSVLLVDKVAFPRWKVCGCSLNRAALQTLAAVGLADLPRRLGAQPLDTLQLRADGMAAELPISGAALSRETLDAALVAEAIRAGAQFLPSTTALLQAEVGDVRHIVLRRGSQSLPVSARVVIAADGLAGLFLKDLPEMVPRVARRASIGTAAVVDDPPADYRFGTIYMASSAGGYVGALRREDGRLAVAAALRPEGLRNARDPSALAEEIFAACRFPHPEMLRQAAWRGTPPLTRRRPFAAERLFVIGDAASYLQPFTGEGMSWAMQSAVLLVPVAREAVSHWQAGLAEQWEERYRRFLQSRQWVCRAVGMLLGHRRLARAAAAILSRAPWLAAPWVSSVNALSPAIQAYPGIGKGVI